MSCVGRHADGGNDGTNPNNRKLQKYMDDHYPNSFFQFNKKFIVNRPVCMICSMEESMRANVLMLSYNKSRSRKIS